MVVGIIKVDIVGGMRCRPAEQKKCSKAAKHDHKRQIKGAPSVSSPRRPHNRRHSLKTDDVKTDQ
jgi:hypothetical protein